MAENEPMAEQMVQAAASSATPWSEISNRFAEGSTHWLATTHPDGRPNVVPIGALWVDGAAYFTTGQGTRKGKNLAENPRCAISFAIHGFDVVIEGKAAKVSDDAKLKRLAEAYAAQGWPAFVHDGVLDAPYSAPTTGPAPYDLYEVTPLTAFAFGTEEETVNQTTRYRF
jgi:uncharacterized pyridoxamine 5'-phosphate oxidase family protein